LIGDGDYLGHACMSPWGEFFESLRLT